MPKSDKILFAVDLKTDDFKVKSGIILVKASSKKAALAHVAEVRKATVSDLEKIGTGNIVEVVE